MELTYEETVALLGAAGLSFSSGIVSDVIIEYCIKHKKYNLFTINTQLVRYEQKPIFVA